MIKEKEVRVHEESTSPRRELQNTRRQKTLHVVMTVIACCPCDYSRLMGYLMGVERLAASLVFVASANTKRLLWGKTHNHGTSVVPQSEISWQLVGVDRFTHAYGTMDVHSRRTGVNVIKQQCIHINPPSIGNIESLCVCFCSCREVRSGQVKVFGGLVSFQSNAAVSLSYLTL